MSSAKASESQLINHKLIEAREIMGDDFFGGWQPSDASLFSRFSVKSSPTPGFITDFLGIKTRIEFVPWATYWSGKVIEALPIPDDSVRAEAIEYFALLNTFENTPGNEFTLVELGASYGPWSCVAGTLSKRMRKRHCNLVAVEASSFMFDLIEKHLSDNDISSATSATRDTCQFNIVTIQGAMATSRGDFYFPVVQSAGENGGQAVGQVTERDYVGRQVEHEHVKGVTIEDVVVDLRIVDLMHIDIQGAEFGVVKKNAELLSNMVRFLFIGTHSRQIEGDIIEVLRSHGWFLLRERPTKFSFRSDLASLEGMTTRDGGQYWMNQKLVAP